MNKYRGAFDKVIREIFELSEDIGDHAPSVKLLQRVAKLLDHLANMEHYQRDREIKCFLSSIREKQLMYGHYRAVSDEQAALARLMYEVSLLEFDTTKK